jgi:hypothetical protein
MEKGMDRVGLRSFSFSYNASSKLSNYSMGTVLLDSLADRRFIDFLGYQLGVEGRSAWDIVTGDMDERSALGGMEYRKDLGDASSRYSRDVRTSGRSYSVSTSMRIPEPVDLSLTTVKLGWGDDYTHRPDSVSWDSSYTWPDFTVGASSGMLKNIDFVSTHMQQLSLNSQYNYSHNVSWSGRTDGEDEKWKHAFEPLIRLTGSLKKRPIRISYHHNFTTDKQKGTAGKWLKGTSNADNVSVNYEIKQTTKIPEIKIFKWTIPIKGKTDVGLTAEHSHSVRFENEETEGDLDKEGNEDEDRRTLALTPQISYVFTDNVTGTARYSGRREIDEVGDIRTMSHLFEIIVNIRF